MRWDELDLDAGTWTFRQKGDTLHVVPLSTHATELLRALQPGAKARVFPGVYATNRVMWLEPIRKRVLARGVGQFTAHDLRRTCATGLARMGTDKDTIALVLGHAVRGGGAMISVYDLYDRLEERRAALQAWADHVARVTTAGATVV